MKRIHDFDVSTLSEDFDKLSLDEGDSSNNYTVTVSDRSFYRSLHAMPPSPWNKAWMVVHNMILDGIPLQRKRL